MAAMTGVSSSVIARSRSTAAHVREDLGADVDLVLEGGASEIGIESTIVDLSQGDAVLLRPGKISAAELKEIIPVKEKDISAVRHSGGMERHYAPKTPARLVPTHELDQEISKLTARAAAHAGVVLREYDDD